MLKDLNFLWKLRIYGYIFNVVKTLYVDCPTTVFLFLYSIIFPMFVTKKCTKKIWFHVLLFLQFRKNETELQIRFFDFTHYMYNFYSANFLFTSETSKIIATTEKQRVRTGKKPRNPLKQHSALKEKFGQAEKSRK